MVFYEETEEFLMPRAPASTDPAFETFDGSDWNPDVSNFYLRPRKVLIKC